MTTSIMEEYLTKVIFPKIHSRQQQFTTLESEIPHARLFLDGHASRRNINLWEEAKKLNIDVHILPAHTTHLIQPLDRGVFGTMKKFIFFYFIFINFFFS